ncbi:M20/M25/M40 family metallo-hydrolase [Sediminibacterium soli]|uniref:M20/M25/M40 family metallo-hydrolase n=1 Tax=Sediminibacterium soli TaxID=2698829 RepID=UPI00192A59BD|nr:M20/M25/M40 family metallo-hydrolase [Sediminibacterium soli]
MKPTNFRFDHIRHMAKLLPVAAVLLAGSLTAQDAVVDRIVKEGTGNSQLEKLAHELLDKIGPRLTGTPQLKQANDWAVAKYTEWGVPARNEQWGEWKGWERGVTHIDMVSPRIKSLEGTQLAWSPSTRGKTVTGELVIIPDLADSIAFQQWLPNVKGKFVMVSMNQPTGRPDYNWQEFATKESFDKLKKERAEQSQQWTQRIRKTGYSVRMLQVVLEKAGAIGIVGNNWSQGFGVDKIFNAYTHKIPTVDIALEDYGLLYRLVESGANPRIAVRADSKDQGTVPVFNTLAEIKGTQKPDEYVMLSAHFDSWDGGTGATDNGTGTLTMMEAMRILKAVYPNPKRTILVGHWASEEQGLNGSRAFVEDHPEIVNKLQALFNQDNGTGRVVNISGQGFQHAGDFIKRWLAAVPAQLRDSIRTSFPGSPGGGGSDFASFVAVGAPGFSLSSLSWSYFNYTWHTNRDTYDKIVFDDLRNNAVLTAIMVYMASEDPAFFPRDRATLGNDRTGRPAVWPAQVKAIRKGPVAPAN